MRVISNQAEGGVIGGAIGRGHFLNGAPEETDLPDELARQLIADGVAHAAEGEEAPTAPEPAATELRLDGPTLEEFVAAGYKAENYPPAGYAAKPSHFGAPGQGVTSEGKE